MIEFYKDPEIIEAESVEYEFPLNKEMREGDGVRKVWLLDVDGNITGGPKPVNADYIRLRFYDLEKSIKEQVKEFCEYNKIPETREGWGSYRR